MMIAKERLYLTRDGKKLVSEGDPAGATLYAAPGDEIPASAAEMFGLKDGKIGGGKAKAPAGDKPKVPAGDKEKAPANDKDAGGQGAGA